MMLSGSRADSTAMPKVPSTWWSASQTAWKRSPLSHLADQMGEHLGVGLRVEMVAFALKAGAQGAVVLDDAVVDQRDVAGLVEMRVGVGLGGRAVGGPAGVGDARGGALAKRAAGHSAWALVVEHGDFARGLGDDDPVVIEHGDARRVIAAVFEPAQPVDEHGGRVRLADVSDDAAHGEFEI